MSTKRTPPDIDAPPRKMSLLGPKTASERAVRTIRKCGPPIPVAVALPLQPQAQPQAQPQPQPVAPQPNPPVEALAVEGETLQIAATDKKPKKDKKKKSKKKKAKKSKGKKAEK